MRNRVDGREICFRSMIVFTLLLSLGVPAQSQVTKVYTVDRASNQLREINPSTGATISSVAITVTTGSPPPTVRAATGLATDPTTSKLYALLEFSALVPGTPQTRTLATINPNTGVATLIGSTLTRSYADLTFSSTGTLYAITGDGSTNPSTLFTMDKATAATTQVVVLGHGDDGEAIAFNSDNNLIYHMSGTNESGLIPPPTMVLETINPASPSTAPVNIPIVGVAISEATAIVYQGTGTFLWADLLNQPYPPTTSRLMTMTTGGVPAVRGSLAYTATGIAIVRVFNLTVNVVNNGTATGTVASVPIGVTCGSPTLNCPTPFTGGSQVTLTATPGANSLFGGWSGGVCTGTGSCVVDMTADKSVTATFTQAATTRTLTVTRTGTGTVTSAPAGTPALDCGTTCAVTFPDGQNVVLTATPGAGNSFIGWGGACSGTGTCSVAMTADRTVSATFAAVQTLTVVKVGTGSGVVTSNPAGINCGSACAATFAQGTAVALSAAAGAGASFTSWAGGGCSGNSTTCTVQMTGPQTVTAAFATTAVPDFTFGPTPDNQVVHKTDGNGGYATYVVTINGTGGLSGSVVIACAASTPGGATCTNPAPAAITLTPDVSGNSTGTSTVRVFVPISGDFGMPVRWFSGPWLWWLGTLFALLLVAPAFKGHRRGRLRVATGAGGLLIVVMIAAVGSACSSNPDTNLGPVVTDYQVPITATSQTPPIQRTQIVPLQAVQP